MRRRAFLRGGLTIGGVAFLGGTDALVEALAGQSCKDRPAGELLSVVPLHGATPRATPFGQIVGGPGLDARRFADLSRLEPGRLITPTREMFLRTAAPAALDPSAAWPLPIDRWRRAAKPMGAHLIECSGNTDPDNFGLMSVCEWDGLPLTHVMDSLPPHREAAAVLVSGLDHPESSRSSHAGASWVLPLDAVKQTGAFLAFRVNGEPLPADHGAPVRLVVPGWYGCSWIKWVNDIRLVGPDEPITSQMIEFSLRTHQPALPTLARDYQPPVIDLAAMPIRVEKRRVAGRIEYRVVGIVWGGDRPVTHLQIRFRAGEPSTPFPICPAPRTHRTWSLWEYRWRPTSPGLYSIALTAADPTIRTRRLDVSFYVRRVLITDV
ncbi:MAG TPA: molybdopterin-dependent oxidoreductase [Vicinamibacterales bacterium]|nr:molybdopterin-dependent oxidoreductase [Vicinamibacterales bacterium]